MKKKIGISYTRSHFKNYWNWFTTNDLEDDIELIELNFEENNTNDIYKCDGFVLTGGVDVHPSFYNGKKIIITAPVLLNLNVIFSKKKFIAIHS
jgi:putative glutamine amidotransferase